MERLIDWWCALIGITDPQAIQIAVGIAGAGTLYLALVLLWTSVWFAIGAVANFFEHG